tara:strand:+ start:1736 stop:3466 length:1731 start_codon:yes stop_codon:yes gene_type:complete
MGRDFRDAQYIGGQRREDGSIIPAEALTDSYEERQNYIPFPCIGIIVAVRPVDDPENWSRKFNETLSHTWSALDSSGYMISQPESASSVGPQVECDVYIIKGFVTDEPFIQGVPFCPTFGGIDNFGFITPQPTTNTSRISELYKSNGDFCVVQFIGGNRTEPVITNIYPHPYNTSGPTIDDGRIAFFRFNGFEFYIDSTGNLHIDGTKASDVVNINPEDGSTTTVEANREVADVTEDHPPGLIIIENNSNIIIEAGTDNNQGDLTLRSKTTMRLRAQTAPVRVDTGDNTQRVDLQGEHGGLRRVAREGDRISLSAGEDGGLFQYLTQLRGAIFEAGRLLSVGSPEAAGAILSGFATAIQVPPSQEGKIVEGSDYCKIGGRFRAADIGDDESGYVDDDGNQLDTSNLLSDCLENTIASYTEKYLENPQQDLVNDAIKAVEDVAVGLDDTLPYGPPVATILRTAEPFISRAVMGGGDNSSITTLLADLTGLQADRQQAIDGGNAAVVIELESQITAKAKEIAAAAPNLSFTDPDVQLGIELEQAGNSGDYTEVDALTGGAFSDALEVCVDNGLEAEEA